MFAVAVLRGAEVSQHRAIAHVVIGHVQVGQLEGLDTEGEALFVKLQGQAVFGGVFFSQLLQGAVIGGGAAIHGAAQGRQGRLVVAGLNVDHAQLAIDVRAGGVKEQGFLSVA